MLKKGMVWMMLVLSLIVFAPRSYSYVEVQSAGDYFSAIGTKFGRGLWDVVSSPAEIPCTMKTQVRDNGGSGYATGFGLGTVHMLRRILSGVTEVGTFMIPMDRTIPPVCTEPAAGSV
jgi:putative exosortase-associated protein (TIGR04073 family)